MGIMKRVSTIFQAKANSALNKAEDPRQTLDLSYEQQLDNLTKVKRAVADVATARKRVEIQAEQLKSQGDKLAEQAKAALAQNNEPLAREALSRRQAITVQLADLETQHATIVDQEQKLTDTAQRLQVEVEAFRTKKETIKATYTAAEASAHISESVSGISTSMGDAGAAMQRAQDKVAEMQARSGALDELLASGALTDLTSTNDDIQAQLDKAKGTSDIDAQIAALKTQVASGATTELASGDAAAAPAPDAAASPEVMADSKIESDHGLNVRMFMTGLALVILYVIIFTVLLNVGVQLVFVIVICGGLLFSQYYFSDKIAMFSMHAKEVTPAQEPKLHQIVDRLCLLANMEKPRVGVAEMDIPNAFATGRSPNHAVICATRGLMNRLNDEELEAVLAHELSHVAHRDVAIMTIASGVGMLAGLVSRIALWSTLLSGGGRSRSGNQIVLLEMLTFVVSIVIYVIAFLLTMALSRYRELAADRSGAILIGKPSVLASALVHVTGDMGRIPRTDLRKSEGMNAFFFAPALAGNTAASLFSTHPSLEKRLDALKKLEVELNG